PLIDQSHRADSVEPGRRITSRYCSKVSRSSSLSIVPPSLPPRRTAVKQPPAAGRAMRGWRLTARTHESGRRGRRPAWEAETGEIEDTAPELASSMFSGDEPGIAGFP